MEWLTSNFFPHTCPPGLVLLLTLDRALVVGGARTVLGGLGEIRKDMEIDRHDDPDAHCRPDSVRSRQIVTRVTRVTRGARMCRFFLRPFDVLTYHREVLETSIGSRCCPCC